MMFLRLFLLYVQTYGKNHSKVFLKNSNTFLEQKYSYNLDNNDRRF
jgi:hypothetical protein